MSIPFSPSNENMFLSSVLLNVRFSLSSFHVSQFFESFHKDRFLPLTYPRNHVTHLWSLNAVAWLTVTRVSNVSLESECQCYDFGWWNRFIGTGKIPQGELIESDAIAMKHRLQIYWNCYWIMGRQSAKHLRIVFFICLINKICIQIDWIKCGSKLMIIACKKNSIVWIGNLRYDLAMILKSNALLSVAGQAP